MIKDSRSKTHSTRHKKKRLKHDRSITAVTDRDDARLLYHQGSLVCYVQSRNTRKHRGLVLSNRSRLTSKHHSDLVAICKPFERRSSRQDPQHFSTRPKPITDHRPLHHNRTRSLIPNELILGSHAQPTHQIPVNKSRLVPVPSPISRPTSTDHRHDRPELQKLLDRTIVRQTRGF
jgi:hypothetical protein